MDSLVLSKTGIYSRSELRYEIEEERGRITDANFKRILQILLKEGKLLRVGRNAYCASDGRMNYSYAYSDISNRIADYITVNNPYLDFTITEFVQLNEFVNHLIAHNIFFLYVESDLGDFLFEPLNQMFPGKVLLHPDLKTYDTYFSDNIIIIQRLISQSPKDKKINWHSRIEKILVDLFSDPILKNIVTESEYPRIFEGAFERYAIDENSLLRYAGRRGIKDEVLGFIRNETDITLRTVENDAE